MTEFCFNTYLPEARMATKDILPLPDEEKSKLRGNVFGTLLKLLYAFLWQVKSSCCYILLTISIDNKLLIDIQT